MKKKWTEARAWRYLAGRWDRPWRDSDVWCATVYRQGVWGICTSLTMLSNVKVIDLRMTYAMRDRMGMHRPDWPMPTGYWWPLTLAGARKRAAFCRKMAKEAA